MATNLRATPFRPAMSCIWPAPSSASWWRASPSFPASASLLPPEPRVYSTAVVVVVCRIDSSARGRQIDAWPAIATASCGPPFVVSAALACWHVASAFGWLSVHDCCCVGATKSTIEAAATIVAVGVAVEPCRLEA